MERILLSIFILLVILSGYSFSEEIKQEFDKRQEFESFWDISTWGNDQQQYSTSNVLLDTVHGWVRLKISASPQGVKPVVAEITSKRNNFLYGSYRASIKFDNVPGGVVGWFVYRTTEDLHEIDVEYLTRDINNIHFTLHHVQTSVDYKMKPISFDPTADFHEYRFDWYPDKVLYFIDGQKVDSLTKKVPDAACTIMLNFWSANIAEWGGAAPTRDTYMYVDYMRYSSDLTSIKSQPTTEVPTSGKIYISSNNGTISITTEKTSSVNDNLSIFTVSGKRIYTDRNPVCTGAKKSWVFCCWLTFD
jgi:beta-glucanase (GH16 family)